MSEAEAKDAFIIFDEAYEGDDVDACYIGDILRALGCNVTNAKVLEVGGTTELGVKRFAFADFLPVLAAVKADTSATGCREDYVEGLKVFDKEGTGKVPLPEILNVLCSLGEKLDSKDADKLMLLFVVGCSHPSLCRPVLRKLRVPVHLWAADPHHVHHHGWRRDALVLHQGGQ